MSYSNGLLDSPSQTITPQRGLPGVGFKLTDDGNYDIDGKRLTDVADSIGDNDAVNLKVLKEHTQVSQNNYHLQPSFKIFKDFGDKSQLTVGSPPNTSPDHFFQNHKAHNDAYIIEKEGYDTGFGGQAWSSIKIKDNQLESGSYTCIFEIFVIGYLGGFRVDDTIIYHVYGDSHYTINTFDSDKINSQYTKAIIQFTTDGVAGVDDGIKFQIRYYGSQYNKNIKFLFYLRVIKGKQSTSFNHNIFNVSDVDDNHKILYFENLNMNSNLINGLGDPVDDADAANKKFVDTEIAKVLIDTTPLLPRDGSKQMTGNLNMGGFTIKNVKPFVEDDSSQAASDAQRNEIINYGYFKDERADIMRQITDLVGDALPKDGSESMQGDLDMNNNEIKNLKYPQISDVGYAAPVDYVNATIASNNTVISNIIDVRLKELEGRLIELVQQENAFKKVMDDDLFIIEDDDIHKVAVVNKDFHKINKKTYQFKIDYDSSNGYYSTRLGVSVIYLPISHYTLVFEMFFSNKIDPNQITIDAPSNTVTVNKINTNYSSNHTRSIIIFDKYEIRPSDDELEIDIALKNKKDESYDSETNIYVIVYGIYGSHNNVPIEIWDRIYYIDDYTNKLTFEAPIDMQNKKITGVADGTANNDVVNKSQLDVLETKVTQNKNDMGNKKITGVADGTDNNDAVNKSQLDALETKINEINRLLKYNYNTRGLKHNNERIIKFPNFYRYPYQSSSSVIGGSLDTIIILEEGYYHIIYTDYYKNGGTFKIYQGSSKVLFDTNLNSKSDWTPFTINAVIRIKFDSGRNSAHIRMKSDDKDIMFDGINNSSFFIEYIFH